MTLCNVLEVTLTLYRKVLYQGGSVNMEIRTEVWVIYRTQRPGGYFLLPG